MTLEDLGIVVQANKDRVEITFRSDVTEIFGKSLTKSECYDLQKHLTKACVKIAEKIEKDRVIL